MEKNKLLVFIFAFFPGAGEMYLGMMKKGSIIMSAFLMMSAVAAFFSMTFILFGLPIIWFYAFFDTLNMQHFNYMHRMDLDDTFYENTVKLVNGASGKDFSDVLKKRHVLIGVVCIFAGGYSILTRFVSMIWDIFEVPYWVLHFIRSIPTLIVAVIIIFFGFYLLKGEEIKKDDDLIEYKGEDKNG